MEELEAFGPRPSISSSPVRHEHKRSEPDSQHHQRAEKSLPLSPGSSSPARRARLAPQPCSPTPAPALHARPNPTPGLDEPHLHLHLAAIPRRTQVPPLVSPCCPAPSLPARHGRVPWAASGAGQLLAMLLQAPACCPGGLGKAQGGCVGLEAGAGAGRSFHPAAWEGGSTAGCVTPPHPAQLCCPSPSAPACQETPSAGAGSHSSARPPASHPAPLTKASFLPSPPSQLFVPCASVTAPSEVPTGCPCPGLGRPRQSPSTEGSQVPEQGLRQHPPAPSHPQHPSWQTPGCTTQHPAPQTPALTPAPPQAAQALGLTPHLAEVSGSQAEPLATGGVCAEDQGGTSSA